MLAKQEKISKFFLPSDEGNLHPIENKIVSMDPNTPRCQNDHLHIAIKLKVPFTIFYHICGHQGEIPNEV
jgi:hypothetical protein